MKTKLILLVLFLFGGILTIQAQSKKDLEKDLNATKTEKDSILRAYTKLKAKNDSLQKVLNVISGIDTSIQNQVLSDSSVKRSNLDSTTKSSTKTNTPQAPVSNNKTSNSQLDELRSENERLKYTLNQYFGKGTIPATQKDLTGLWALSLQYFKITEDSSKSGLITVPAPGTSRAAVRIIFIDYELAEITYNTEETVKCFYKVNSFSATQPYSIDFTKGPELTTRLQVNPTSGNELQVSYKKGNGYYSGFMRKML